MDASQLGAELADSLHGNDGVIEKLRTDQQFMAESEIVWVKDKAIIGASHPIGINDNHNIHIETVILAKKIMIAKAISEPWNLNNVKEFTGLTDHGIQHINALNEGGFTEESQTYLVEIQGLVNRGRELSAEVDRQEQGVGESIDEQIKMQDAQLKQAKVQNDTMRVQIAMQREQREQQKQQFDQQHKTRQQSSAELIQVAHINNQKPSN